MLKNVVQDGTFKASLEIVLRFIALDSKSRARYFKSGLQKELQNLIYMPYKFRKSIYFDKEEVRGYPGVLH